MAYNTGIITAMFVLGGRWGVRSAAVGVAVGGALMVVTQLPSVLRQLRRRGSSAAPEEIAVEEAAGAPMAFALVAPVLLFALTRQSQVLIERFLASTLPAGAISHLNYAQKVAQIPMTLSLMLCTVTFPVVAQAIAEGDTERARSRVERDIALAAWVVLLGASSVIACAPQIIELLFQRGAFTSRDTEATATVMRVYAVGLLGHTLVGALVRSYFSSEPAHLVPAGRDGGGHRRDLVDRRVDGRSVGGTRHRRRQRRRDHPVGRPAAVRDGPAQCADPDPAGAGRAAQAGARGGVRDGRRGVRDQPDRRALAGLAAGAATVTVVYLLLGRLMRAQAVQSFVLVLRSARSMTRRLPHARKRTRAHARPRTRRRDRVR